MSLTSLSLTGNPFGPFDTPDGYKDVPRSAPIASGTRRGPPGDAWFACLEPYCDASPFQRKVDLDVHYRDAHARVADERYGYRHDFWPARDYTIPSSLPVAYSYYSASYTCLRQGCTAMPFSRKTDLDRHSQQDHAGSPTRSPLDPMSSPYLHQSPPVHPPRLIKAEAYPQKTPLNASEAPGRDLNPFEYRPDWERRWRQIHQQDDPYHYSYAKPREYSNPFSRGDHYRDHLRDYHGEHIPKMGRKHASVPKAHAGHYFDGRHASKG